MPPFTTMRAPMQGGGAARGGSGIGRRKVGGRSGGGGKVPIQRPNTKRPLTAAAADGQLPQAKRVSKPPPPRDAYV